MLDDHNLLKNRDPYDALGVAAAQADQLRYQPKLQNVPDPGGGGGQRIERVIVAGMGGSALAAGLAKTWLRDRLRVPLDIVRDYSLPAYADDTTLVIASSYSGNTEETLSALADAVRRGAIVTVVASGGQLTEQAIEAGLPYVQLPGGQQPRMAVLNNLCALAVFFEAYGLGNGLLADIHATAGSVAQAITGWLPSVPTADNLAKTLALHAVGKTPVIYGSPLSGPLAYKWKISFNENAKNVAFCNEIPEFNHNEFMGWTSHPIEKPFAVFDLRSPLDHPQVAKRFEVSDRLLSGRRPKSVPVQLEGDSLLEQLMWGSVLGDFVTIYTAILNGVDPTKVDLIEKLKTDLA